MVIGFFGINPKSVSYSIYFEKAGHKCLFYDIDEDKVFNINNKIFLSEEMDIHFHLIDRINISGSTDVSEVIKSSEILFDFIDCPANTDGTIDISKVFDTIQKFYLASHLEVNLYNKGFVLGSVLNPGDCKILYEKISQFGLRFAYLPNFLTESKIYKSISENNLVVLGTNSEEFSQILSNLFRQIKSGMNINIMSMESAELVKFAISSIVAYKVVVANLIGDYMISMGIDKEIPLVLNSVSNDPRIGSQHMKYGLGYGGPNLGKEIRAFSEFTKNKKVEQNIFEMTEKANEEHTTFLKYYYMTLNPDKSKPFVIESIGYKKGSIILEDSQRLKLCMELLQEGYMINCIEDLETANKLINLSEMYENRLKFYKKDSKPEGVKISL